LKEIKQILNEIVNQLETIGVHLGALEAALIERGVISTAEVDDHKGVLSLARISVKHMLVNARHAISQLPTN
jgi:hypothetical protein